MSKDYYQILGLNKDASRGKLKLLIASWPFNTIGQK